MPRYFFHVQGTARDPDGVELKDLATAKCEAVRAAAQLLCDGAGEFWDTGDFAMTVSNEKDLTLFRLMFVGVEAAAIAADRPV